MAKRPKLRMTNADYVAIAVSPALIMALVGSLVYFLIEILYVGQYQARIMYVFALFVFATVLIGRISIEMGADRAALFALPLGIAMFLVLAKFVPHASPFSHVINIGLLGIVWWSTHKLTWDCTLIDDNEDASGEGLMQRIGADDLEPDGEDEVSSSENELLPTEEAAKKKTPHTPGLWVLYYSLAALPLFGIGQKWIPAGDVGRRQYAFGLLTVYVAAGLALLVTTSFLGLRRYLRQRRVEMPAPMAATWVVTGGVLIVVVMLLAALVPRPQAEYAISQVPWQVDSPTDLASSRTSVGGDGTEDENEAARKVLNDETDPNATATREGDDPTTTSEEGEKQASGGESGKDSEASPSEQSEQGEQAGSSESGKAESQPDQQQSPAKPTESNEQSEIQQDDQKQNEEPPAPSSESAEENSRSTDASGSEAAGESTRPPPSLPDLMPEVGGLAGVFKILLYVIVAIVLGSIAWRKRREIAKAIREFVQQVRDFLAQLFGKRPAKPASGGDDETVKPSGMSARPFASFADPFASGQSRSLPPDEVVRYTFEAFEAWARERGYPRSLDQTPLELICQAVPKQSPLETEARQLARLYNEAAYAPGSVSASGVEVLAKLWTLLRQSPAVSTVGADSA